MKKKILTIFSIIILILAIVLIAFISYAIETGQEELIGNVLEQSGIKGTISQILEARTSGQVLSRNGGVPLEMSYPSNGVKPEEFKGDQFIPSETMKGTINLYCVEHGTHITNSGDVTVQAGNGYFTKIGTNGAYGGSWGEPRIRTNFNRFI